MESAEIKDLDIRRQELEFLFRKARHAQIGRIEGIKKVKKRQDYPDDDCGSFAIGIPWGNKELIDKFYEIVELPDVEEREKGDYVLYLNKNGDFTHMGIYKENDLVVSKWDKSHVYEHPMMLVPSSFGDTTRVVRNPDKTYVGQILDSL